MPNVKAYKVLALPGTPDTDSLYFVKGASDTAFRFYLTNSSGAAIEIDAVNAAAFASAMATKEGIISPGTTGQYWRGDKTWQALNKAAVGLDQVDNTSDANKPVSNATQTALNLKANDNAVVHTSGNETLAGIKTFSSSPVVPTATTGTQAVNKAQMDAADTSLQNQINTINTSIASGLEYKGDIDASANPNYPAATPGDVYLVSVAGKIGGASGKDVSVGNMLVNKTASAAGTQAAVGANWTVIQSDLDQASETISGFTRYSTPAEALAGTNDASAMTPLKVQSKINATAVKFDVSQSLTGPQQVQARANINAADDANTVHKTGSESIAGAKTFTSEVTVPTATLGGSAPNKTQMDSAIAAAQAAATFVWGTVAW